MGDPGPHLVASCLFAMRFGVCGYLQSVRSTVASKPAAAPCAPVMVGCTSGKQPSCAWGQELAVPGRRRLWQRPSAMLEPRGASSCFLRRDSQFLRPFAPSRGWPSGGGPPWVGALPPSLFLPTPPPRMVHGDRGEQGGTRSRELRPVGRSSRCFPHQEARPRKCGLWIPLAGQERGHGSLKPAPRRSLPEGAPATAHSSGRRPAWLRQPSTVRLAQELLARQWALGGCLACPR